jgi:hypothetical protein
MMILGLTLGLPGAIDRLSPSTSFYSLPNRQNPVRPEAHFAPVAKEPGAERDVPPGSFTVGT